MSETKSILNIAMYRFLKLKNLPELRVQFKNFCTEHQLKGTILLSPEGINCFLAGEEGSIRAFQSFVPEALEADGFEFKESFTDYQPFSRMLVKLKKEIIPMGLPEIDPVHQPAPRLSAKEFKQWLDEGREVVILDTRNDYEIRVGTFENAIDLGIRHFRNFPKAIKTLPEEFKKKTIVSFCTGGIRCEKAAPLMIQEGFENVYQLEGGILKYFEEVGGSHYQGDCFVFDYRVAVNPELKETEVAQCFNCRMPVTPEEQKLDSYVPGISCIYCIEGKKHAHQ